MVFKRDFKLGKHGETTVLEAFKNRNVEIEENTDKAKRKDFDLVGKLGRKKFSVEVKLDWMCDKTNNLAIEYHNCKKDEPSGVDATKADLWAHVILDQGFPTIWLTSVSKLKDFIKTTTPWKIIAKAGDGNASLYLYRHDIILESIFTRIDNITEEEFKKLMKKLLKEN